MTSHDLVAGGLEGPPQAPLQISRIEHHVEFGGETGHWAEDDPRSNPESLTHVFFIIQRHVVKHLPNVARRAGMNETEILVAFPIHRYGCGSRCFIQADFITSGEQDIIDGGAQWNAHLVDAIVTAFQEAGDRLNNPNIPEFYKRASFTWPNLLRNEAEGCSPLWPQIKEKVIKALKARPSLHSRDETNSLDLKCPSQLKFVPPHLRFKGEPLIEDPETRKFNLSFLYDVGTTFKLGPIKMPEVLGPLGVREKSIADFLDDLESIITRNGISFLDDRSCEWHQRLARILYESGAKERVAQIPLIPLGKYRWVKSSEANLYRVPETDDLPIPNSLCICVVDPEAFKDRERALLFNWLGIRSINRAQICQEIVQQRDSCWRKSELSDHISNIMYLYETPTSVFDKRLQNFRLTSVDQSSEWKVYPAGSLYVDGPFNSFAISRHANRQESGVRLLHPAYLESFNQKEQKWMFIKWLISHTEIANLPRLIDAQHKILTTEFKYFTTKEIPELIKLLQNYPYHYGPQLDVELLGFNGRSFTLREKLSEVILAYSGLGRAAPLVKFSRGHTLQNASAINKESSNNDINEQTSHTTQKYHSDDDNAPDDFNDSGLENSPKATTKNRRKLRNNISPSRKDPFNLIALTSGLPRSQNADGQRRTFGSRLMTPSPSHRRSVSASKIEELDENWSAIPPVFFEHFSKSE